VRGSRLVVSFQGWVLGFSSRGRVAWNNGLCVSVCTHAHTHTHVYAYIYIYIHVHIDKHITYVYSSVCVVRVC
jgi:hypothetical protein